MRYTSEDILREKAKRSYYSFFKQAWHIVEPSRELITNWHIEYLCDVAEHEIRRIARNEPKEHDFIINIPFRALKSKIFTVMLHPWAWIEYPHLRFQTASYSHNLALNHSNQSRRIIMSDWYQRMFGDSFRIKDTISNATTLKATESFFENSEGGYRHVTSVQGSSMGYGANVNIADDPLKTKEANSPTYRERAVEWWKETFRSRTDDFEVDTFFLIMQRLHENDVAGNALAEDTDGKAYFHINIPARLTKEVKPKVLKLKYEDKLFFKERFSHRVLERLKDPATGLGVKAFSAQVQQSPTQEGGNLFKKPWFNRIMPADIPRKNQIARAGYFFDTAFTEDETNSAIAYVLAILGMDRNLYIKDCGFAWLEVPDQVKWIADRAVIATPYIEPKASGKGIAQTLNHQGITAVELDIEGNQKDKVYRANLVITHVEAGRVYVSSKIWDTFLNDDRQGILKFPDASHDDLGDAFVMSLHEFLGVPKIYDSEDLESLIEPEEESVHTFN